MFFIGVGDDRQATAVYPIPFRNEKDAVLAIERLQIDGLSVYPSEKTKRAVTIQSKRLKHLKSKIYGG